jgi:hypothetical protein
MFQVILIDDTNTFTVIDEVHDSYEDAERTALILIEELEEMVDYQILPALLPHVERQAWCNSYYPIHKDDSFTRKLEYQGR